MTARPVRRRRLRSSARRGGRLVALGEDQRRGAEGGRSTPEHQEPALAARLARSVGGVDNEPEERATEGQRDAGIGEGTACDLER